MISDTAITDPKLTLRDRRHLPKVEASADLRALIGFAGDAENGVKITSLVRNQPARRNGLDLLVQASKCNHSVEFAYAFFENGRPLLFRIRLGAGEQLATFHLGSTAAFDTFQRIRHRDLEPYAPQAMKIFMSAAQGLTAVPEGLSTAICSFMDLFATHVERDVGGWAVPYVLTSEGAHFCSYGYGVSDPNIDRLPRGSIVPHGTAQGGGANLSVTELPDRSGFVIYWLQLTGGTVLRRSSDGSYEQRLFRGSPSEFKQLVWAATGQAPDLWIADQSAGPIKSLKMLRGPDGNIDMVLGDHGDAFTFALHNVSTRFDSAVQASMANELEPAQATDLVVHLSADKQQAIVSTLDEALARVTLGVKDIDALLLRLAWIRTQMLDPIPTKPIGGQKLVTLDPAWRTERSPHPGLEGILMTLRHGGFGWLDFFLPNHEARSLGHWLMENAGTTFTATSNPKSE